MSFETKSKKTLLNHSKYLKVEEHTVVLPDGQEINDWSWLVMPDHVSVLAVTKQGQFLCFKQTKYSLNGSSYAPAGGYVEPNEHPLESAKRELREETGFESTEWIHLGSFVVDANRGAGNAHLYLALNARFIGEVESDDLEEQNLHFLSLKEIRNALNSGEVKLLSWVATFSLGLKYIEDNHLKFA